MVVLEKLTPRERAIFLLKEIFAYDYYELAELFEITTDNARQILRRAKITGFTIMAGAVLADFTLSARLNRYLPTDKARALILLEASAGLAPLIGAGALLLILTGTGMARPASGTP
jgi:hypothetical protein